MRRLNFVAAGFLVLSSCAGLDNEPSFENMTAGELALHNSTVSADQMVLCFEDVRIGSHIRQTYCATVEELTHALAEGVNTLDTLNYGPRSDVFGLRPN